jgi:hypothetical protein
VYIVLEIRSEIEIWFWQALVALFLFSVSWIDDFHYFVRTKVVRIFVLDNFADNFAVSRTRRKTS